MSLARRVLNLWLRAVEKRRIRTGTPQSLRRALEVQAKLFFHPPRGTVQTWVEHGGIPCLELTPRGAATSRVLFYIHGGGFMFGSPDSHSALAAQLGGLIGARTVMPRYRLAPEAPFPAAPDDIRAAWDGLVTSGVSPPDIVLGGDSAGGALAFGLVTGLLAQGGPTPGAVFGLSPLTDLTYSGDSFRINAQADVVLPSESAGILSARFLCGAAADAPSVSPLFGDFHGAPPAWLTVGDTEILLDDSRRLAEKIKAQGGDVTLIIEHDMPHVWPIFHNTLPEARRTLRSLAGWIRQRQNWAV